MFRHMRFLASALVAAALALLSASIALADPPSAQAARLDTYGGANGETYFALSLTPPRPAGGAAARDVLVLFDTSASQAGAYREKALATLRSMLAKLGPRDRVQLLAVDLKAIPLTEGFVPAHDAAVAQALEKLTQRVPLGTTDMAAALSAAAEVFGPAAATQRAAIYIGDGISMAHLLGSEEFGRLVGALVERRVPLSSYAIGPQLDNPFLLALANQTGGMLAVDGTNLMSEDVARFLATAARETVYWPHPVEWPAAMREIYPAKLPPLRADRDTLVFGVAQNLSEPLEVKIEADVAGEEAQPLAWHVTPAKPSSEQAYLTRVIELAKKDGGLSLPTLGTAGLNEMRRMFDVAVEDITRLGRQAVATGNLEQAEQLARQARAFEPDNQDAAIITGAVARLRQADTADAGADLRLVRPAPEAAAADDEEQPAGALLDEAERRARVLAGALEAEVQNAVNGARRMMADSPSGALDLLKLVSERVRGALEVDPAIRQQLSRQVENALQEAERRAVIQQRDQIARQEIEATQQERLRILNDLTVRQEQIEQSVVRFNALVDQKRYGDAMDVIEAAVEMDPNLQSTDLARAWAYMNKTGRETLEQRRLRQIGVVDTLASVERSHIPTPDEPPILYPDPETWQLLTQSRKKYASVDLSSQKPAEKKISEELDKPTTLDFVETPLSEVITYLKDFHNIEIQLDAKALDEASVTTDTPITRNLQGVTLRSALRLILKDLDLTYVITDEVLLITTVTEAEDRLSTKVYPVADLVVPIQSMGGGMGGGMMGGMGGMGGMMGGGMGGMGGGMGGMGGGMGGMGGGMGGMGGGMGGMGMGGGMFNVPNRGFMPLNFLQNIPQGGFRPFAVQDDLTISAKSKKPGDALRPSAAKTPSAAKPAKAAAKVAAAKPAAIDLIVPEGADADRVWNDYFATHQEPLANVRETARHLMTKEKFGQVIALIQGALRNGQSQPWMFEGMALAMQANGSSRDDVERALMSALDFTNNPHDMLYLASYLARLGLDARALKLARQVSEIDPTRADPFALGLVLAQRLNDLEGLQWALSGILSQAWPKAHEDLWKRAYHIAEATLEKLRAEKRADEANAFLAALDEAVARDVVIEGKWDGDADVDLWIEEPAGTVCSLRNPRTTSGGVLLEDAYPRLDQQTSGGYRETYVCPRGFDGRYRVLVRRMWGKPAAGKVTIDVYLHTRTKDFEHVRQQVPVGEEDAMVVFDLKKGRRAESLAEHQVATAASEQLAVRRQLLNQQLNSMADESSLRDLDNSRQQIAAAGGLPFVRAGGAVGFQPVIIVLPKGASLRASAVISADRRYVRFSGLPLFSGVSEVNTFSLLTGQSMAQTGGTGSGGFSGGAGGGFGS